MCPELDKFKCVWVLIFMKKHHIIIDFYANLQHTNLIKTEHSCCKSIANNFKNTLWVKWENYSRKIQASAFNSYFWITHSTYYSTGNNGINQKRVKSECVTRMILGKKKIRKKNISTFLNFNCHDMPSWHCHVPNN